MKRLVIFIYFLFVVSLCAATRIPTTERVVEILDFSLIFEEGGLGFSGDEKFTPDEMQGFFEWFRSTEDSISKINQLVENPRLRVNAIVASSQALDDTRYYQIAVSVIERYGNGKATEDELRRVLMPAEDKRGLLSIMCNDAQLRSALDLCIAHYPKDGPLRGVLELILSGEGARNVRKNAGEAYPKRYYKLAGLALSGKVPSLSSTDGIQPGKDMNSTSGVEEASPLNGAWASTLLWAISVCVILLVLFAVVKRLKWER